MVTEKIVIPRINRDLTICALQILLKKETSSAVGDDEIGEVGGARKRKMKGFVQKRVSGDAVDNGGTGGKVQIQNDAALTVIFGDSLQR